MTITGDELLERLDGVIRHIVEIDLPDLPDDEREVLIGHLTGAVFVSLPRPEDNEP